MFSEDRKTKVHVHYHKFFYHIAKLYGGHLREAVDTCQRRVLLLQRTVRLEDLVE